MTATLRRGCHFYPMDSSSAQALARLIRETRIAALATLHNGEPNLAMVAYAFAQDFSAFYIHVSKLGKHTRDMVTNPNVSLLIMESDDGRSDPQTLARVSMQGIASNVERAEAEYNAIQNIYLARFPEAERLFSFGDFHTWKIKPGHGRFVAGFGQAFNLVPEMLVKVSGL